MLETRLKNTGAEIPTPVAINKGGTGVSSAQAALNALTDVASANNNDVITKDPATGNTKFLPPTGGSWSVSGNVIYLTTTTNNVAVGRTSQIGTEKYVLDGTSDVIQQIVRGYSNQTVNISEIRLADNSVVFSATTNGIIVGGNSVSFGANSANVALQFTSAHAEKVVSVTDAPGAVLDLSLGNIFTWVAVSSRTAGTTVNGTNGQKFIIAFTATGGNYTLTLPTATTGDFSYGTDITTITSTGSGLTDVIGCVYGSVKANRCSVVSVVKGY